MTDREFIKDQAALIRRMAEGYRSSLRVIYRDDLDEGEKLRLIKDVLDSYYPGRSGVLFKDAFGRQS